MKRAALAFMVGTIIGGTALLAAEGFSGSLESRMGWYWSSKELLPLAELFEGRVEGKVGAEDLPTAQYSARIKVSLDPATAATTVDMGEAWIKLFVGPLDLSFGNQVVAWGCTDVFIPSDTANPVNLGLPVDPVKMPVPIGRLVLNGDGFSLDLVAEPFWIAPRLPASPWAATSPLPVSIAAVGPTWDNVAYGGHFKASLGLLQGLDVGLTAYRGRSYTPTSTVNFTGPYPSSVTLSYDRLTLLGADLVLAPAGSLLLKTEWGYRTVRDSSLIEPEAGAASLQGVSGFEYRLFGVQIIGEHVLDWTKGSSAEGDTLRHSAVGIVTAEIGERTTVKAAAIHEFKDQSGMVAPQVTYTIADGLQLNCALFFFYGKQGSTYGAWKDNSLGRLSLKYAF